MWGANTRVRKWFSRFRFDRSSHEKTGQWMSKNGSPQTTSEILIVDDEEDIRDLISGILKDEGYETRVAGDGDSALQAVRARRPQLVVLDIWLQGSRLGGIQVLEVLEREQPDLPVVMISGHGTIVSVVASFFLGVFVFFVLSFLVVWFF